MRFARKSLIRVDRHELGPRCFVFGARVHECHLGLAMLPLGALLWDVGGWIAGLAVLAVALWMLVKDWRDLFPATRDTAAWSIGPHRCPDMPPGPPLQDRVPLVAGLATALVGLVNIGSALTPELPVRARALLALTPVAEMSLAHAIALPAGVALLGAAWQLARRRRRALTAAVGLLVLLGAANLFKGLDVEEATLSLGLAAVLWRARAAFVVRHDSDGLARTLLHAALVLGGAYGVAVLSVLAAGHDLMPLAPASAAPARALWLLGMDRSIHAHGAFRWLPNALAFLSVGALGVAGAMLFAPLRLRVWSDARDRARAAGLVRSHGADTLSAFKLRRDLLRRWSPDHRAVAAYRIEAGTLLMAGDPVGPPDATSELLARLLPDARRQGLAVGVVGASEAFALAARPHGLHRVYLGDEAILSTGAMDLSGGRRKSLRKAVNRVARNGYTAALHVVGDLDAAELAELRAVSDRWLDGAPDRGFSMAHDALADDLVPDALVVVARDESGAARGFLHFMPVYGRPIVSLGFMRRDRDTPNGVNDFLVVEAARLLGERGIEEFSLNFAAFGRWLREPSNVAERALGRLLRVADRWFQLDRLHSFNAKFGPRWQPRYLLFRHPAQLPKVALAAMLAEGQLPRPSELAPRRRAESYPAAA
ncbi:MAG: bifunctional lysylphosphatidylglycerol flippase/synthetase MprF [Solirubrobacteraceae bacterium]